MIISYITALFCIVSCYAYVPIPGDLLFQDLGHGLSKAITEVTEQPHKLKISHVALVINKDTVIEAIGNNVHTTKITQFLQRSINAKNQPLVIVGRLIPPYQTLISKAITIALSWEKRPYNHSFTYKNGYKSFYCSQLIYDAFMHANHNIPVFELKRMTFKSTGQTLPEWKKYFDALNQEVPEGMLGSNPGMLSCSPKIRIIYRYR